MPEEKKKKDDSLLMGLTILGILWVSQWYPEVLVALIVSAILVYFFEAYTLGGAWVPAITAIWIIYRDTFITWKPGYFDVLGALRTTPQFLWAMIIYSFIMSIVIELKYSRIEWGEAFYIAVVPIAAIAQVLLPWPLTPMIVVTSLITDYIVYFLHPRYERMYLVVGGGGVKDGINMLFYWVMILHSLFAIAVLADLKVTP